MVFDLSPGDVVCIGATRHQHGSKKTHPRPGCRSSEQEPETATVSQEEVRQSAEPRPAVSMGFRLFELHSDVEPDFDDSRHTESVFWPSDEDMCYPLPHCQELQQ